MSVSALMPLDFSRLRTPAGDGEVLVVPDPAAGAAACRHNAEFLERARTKVAGSPLSYWRGETRRRVIGKTDQLVIAVGHQPAFIHAGVWAKNVMASRLAAAIGAKAVHIVVDSDAPRSTALFVPARKGESVERVAIPFGRYAPGCAFEQVPPLTGERMGEFEDRVRSAMGDAYETSQMPRFLQGVRDASNPRNAVDQMMAGRHAIDRAFGVDLHEVRISRQWWAPLLIEMIERADRFAGAYNRALSRYRAEHRVRGEGRPIPDLAREADRIELPVWAFRDDGPRRRVFVRAASRSRTLYAEEAELITLPPSDSAACVERALNELKTAGWNLRPRALTLTLWARLFLVDFFIHGIGGAKYDRITDEIIADYFGLTPPAMGCVSATLRLPTEHPRRWEGEYPRLAHALRDLQWNPQRHIENGPEVAKLVETRRQLARRADELRLSDRGDKAARRRVFEEIRQVNREILSRRADAWAELSRRVEQARDASRRRDILASREYFIGLFPREKLDKLCQALSRTGAIGV